jgi:hypothetical protein
MEESIIGGVDMKKDAIVEIEREVKTYTDLYQGSYVLFERSKEHPLGNYYAQMGSLIFAAFTFEAYLNHLGGHKNSFWDESERMSVMEKYSALCGAFNVTTDFSRRPYQTIKSLFDFRNALAHGKSRILTIEKEVSHKEDVHKHAPKTKWEEYCTEVNIIRVRKDIEEIIIELNQASGEEEPPFMGGMTVSHMSLKG